MYDCLDDCVVIWSSPDGEQFVGDQEYYVEEPNPQELFDQGKYNMDHHCYLFTLNINFMLHVSTLWTIGLILDVWSCALLPMDFMHWVVDASALMEPWSCKLD